MHPLLVKAEASYIKDVHPTVNPGDTVRIASKIKEGNKERIQAFVGVVIAIRGEGLSKMVKVRKISYGIGVERTFPLHSPNIQKIELVKRGRPRRAKLFYLRDRVGKQALRVKEHPKYKGKDLLHAASPSKSSQSPPPSEPGSTDSDNSAKKTTSATGEPTPKSSVPPNAQTTPTPSAPADNKK
ncbi:50S ribosomal protein L19 [Spirochaetota bacterium]|nr:50S ribosomal protein L19 [Spirochaetota bacterium]